MVDWAAMRPRMHQYAWRLWSGTGRRLRDDPEDLVQDAMESILRAPDSAGDPAEMADRAVYWAYTAAVRKAKGVGTDGPAKEARRSLYNRPCARDDIWHELEQHPWSHAASANPMHVLMAQQAVDVATRPYRAARGAGDRNAAARYRLLVEGESCAELARQYGCSTTIMSREKQKAVGYASRAI